MSDVDLLAFGCVVTFIAVAGAYVYLRDCWTLEEPANESEERPAEALEPDFRDVA